MKRTYRLHESDASPGANEALYTAMSQKGWHLKKRGSYLSRFEKGEPKNYIYRIEYASPRAFEEHELSEEQLAFYEECGLEFAAQHDLVHVFRADADSGIDEIYTDPKQRADMLKAMRRRTVLALFVPFIYAAFWLFLGLMTNRSGDYFAELVTEFHLVFVRFPPVLLFAGAVFFGGFLLLLYDAVLMLALYCRLKRGKLPRRAVKKVSAYRVTLLAVSAAVLISAILIVAQLVTMRSGDLPETSDGMYLTFSEIGIKGERAQMPYKDNASNLEYMKTLTAECWHSYECIEANGEKYWMYQYVYRMPDEAAAKSLVPTLMYEGSFSNDLDEWSAILTEFEGISEAWEGHANLEYLIRRENTVWYITCDADARKDHSIDTKLLAAIAKK